MLNNDSGFLECFVFIKRGSKSKKSWDSKLVHSHNFIDKEKKAKVIYLIENPRSPLCF